MEESGELERQRAEQAKAWMWQELTDGLVHALTRDEKVSTALPDWEEKVMSGETTPGAAADALRALFLGHS